MTKYHTNWTNCHLMQNLLYSMIFLIQPLQTEKPSTKTEHLLSSVINVFNIFVIVQQKANEKLFVSKK